MRPHVGEFVHFCDFNVVSTAQERSGTTFCRYEAEDFNNFILDMDLMALSIGERFTKVDL